MKTGQELPIDPNKVLNSIGENILLADKEFNIVWANQKAKELFKLIIPLYNLAPNTEIIGMNMDVFHERPNNQRDIMINLKTTHRSRINIKNKLVTDIVINPINKQDGVIEGYVVMLMDVTTKDEEEKRSARLIEELSVPIVKIWEDGAIIPLLGKLDIDRFELIITKLLTYSSENRIKYAFISLAGIKRVSEGTDQLLVNLNNMLRLIGTECIVVGISAELALSLSEHSYSFPTFSNLRGGIKYVMERDRLVF
jgi:rsbT co-antagonist protein RsbR